MRPATRKSTIVIAVAAFVSTLALAQKVIPLPPPNQSKATAGALASTNGAHVDQVEVILKSGERGYPIADMVKAAKNHATNNYVGFSLKDAVVTVWIDPASSTNSIDVYFRHGFGGRMVQISVRIDGSLLKHSSSIAQEGN